MALFDEQGRLRGWSPAFGEACTLTANQLAHRNVWDIWLELDVERWNDIWQKVQADGLAVVMQVRERCSCQGCNEIVELEIGRFVYDERWFAKIEYRRSAARRLQLIQQEVLEAMAYGMPLKAIMDTLCRKVEQLAPSVTCSVLEVDPQLRLRHIASPSLPEHYSAAIDGLPIGAKAGSCGTAAYRGEPVEVVDIATDPLWEDYKQLALPLGLRACWSSPIKSSDGRVLGAFAFYYPRSRGPNLLERQIVRTCLHLSMIAMEHEETRSRAYEYAFSDPLTRLANRTRFQQRVSELLALVAETGQKVAVHYVGLDRFQSINEMLGYAAGDEILLSIGSRLATLVRDREALARIGGDEFALVQVGDLKDEDVAGQARRIGALVEEPFIVAGQPLQLGASIGIAIGPEDSKSADVLIHNAALAMRRVKELGRGTYVFYEKHLNERMQRRRRTELDLQNALSRSELELYFQPIFNLKSGAIEQAEALLRWNHPERGMVLPSEFIPLAEQCGLIQEIGEWVIRRACALAASWPASVGVAINLSPLQFENSKLGKVVASALQASGLDPSRLELEITESVLLRDCAVSAAILDELAELGVSIALDDFGTGFSSLSYLQRFKVHRIKIDQSFVRDLNTSAGSLKIVRAIVMLGHSLGLKVTAEGVETDDQLAAVRGEGCDAAQGFYVGVPCSLAEFVEQLESVDGSAAPAA